mmetsp:Transcript_3713/g.8716  ORF Transcript_3713/g.8716 Transcript_3713/m.8716 type:complete len:87 (+) Transcript_3713:1370-1630(+)
MHFSGRKLSITDVMNSVTFLYALLGAAARSHWTSLQNPWTSGTQRSDAEHNALFVDALVTDVGPPDDHDAEFGLLRHIGSNGCDAH